ncbi:MAG: sigma-54 dependent transcriptional regulator, partial [Gemmatimonadota bacterium]
MGADAVLLIGLDDASEAAVRSAGEDHRYAVESHPRLGEGLVALQERSWSATFLSTELGGVEMELVRRLVGEARAGGVVLVTPRASAQLAMEATQAGAREVLEAPLSAEAVTALLGAMEVAGRRVPLEAAGVAEGVLVGSSPELMEVFKIVGRVAASPATVLITGASGTGKELVARAIHEASGRARAAFIAVNCAAIPEDLLESELFGHERGAFTGAIARKIGRFERAGGGTLFLDEIGDMSLVLQAKILRALQEREIERVGGEERIEIDARVVAATHRDLARLIADGEFREDLFYRLAVVRVHLSRLRERGADLRDLALHYTARFAADYGRSVQYISDSALTLLEDHDWPGNVRELRNVLERAVLLTTDDTLRAAHIEIDRSRTTRPTGTILPG